MKSERSMGTLMTVFSGMAALLSLLVGLQLFVLEAQIEQAGASDHPESTLQFKQWKAQAHTGAVMSLGAGVLILLFGLRHHTTTVHPGKIPARQEDSYPATIDPDSLSIRVFESDQDDRYVEIYSEAEGIELPEPEAPLPLPTLPDPAEVSSLAPGLEHEADPTDSIVQSIREAVAPENGGKLPGGSGHSRPSIFGRIFGSRRRG